MERGHRVQRGGAVLPGLQRGARPALEPPRPFEDYIAWLQRQDSADAETFWRSAIKGYSGPTPLSIDRGAGRAGDDLEPYASQQTSLSRDTTAALQRLARAHQITVDTIVQAMWALLLSRYTAEDDVVFGATVSGRPPDLSGVESMVGLFINTLPVRVRVDADEPLLPFLKDLQRQQFEARQYEHTPLVDVQGWSDVPRGTPMFETIVGFENYPMTPSLDAGLNLVQLGGVFERTNYPLSLIVQPGAELAIVLLYETARFDGPSIERMLGHIRTLLEGIAADPDRRLRDLPLTSAAERHQVLVEWNQTSAPCTLDTCVHHLFERWASSTPAAAAVSCERERLDYQALDQRANQIAHSLRRRDVHANTVVAICMPRSSSFVAAVLGVLKAGGAYLPLDPVHPKQSLAYMLSDSGARVLLACRDVADRLPDGDREIVFVDGDGDRSRVARRREHVLGGHRSRLRDLHLGLDGQAARRRGAAPQSDESRQLASPGIRGRSCRSRDAGGRSGLRCVGVGALAVPDGRRVGARRVGCRAQLAGIAAAVSGG